MPRGYSAPSTEGLAFLWNVFADDPRHLSDGCLNERGVLDYSIVEKLSFWGERKDYWHWMAEVAGGIKTLEQLVKRVQGFSEVT